MFYGNLVQLGKRSNSVIKSRSVMVKNGCNVLSMEGVTVCGHHPECHVTFGRGGKCTLNKWDEKHAFYHPLKYKKKLLLRWIHILKSDLDICHKKLLHKQT